jgi:hypothetical protein
MTIFKFLSRICDSDPANWHNDYRYSQIIEFLKGHGIKFDEVSYNDGATKNIYVHFGEPFVNIFGAHYDIVPNVQGALDNGASVAELIGLAINLKGHTGDITIAFLANEENLAGLGSYDDIGSKCMALNELKSGYEKSIILDVCARGDVILTREDCNLDFSGYKHAIQTMPVTDDWIINNTMSVDDKYDNRSLLLSVLPESELQSHETWHMLHTTNDILDNVESDTLEMMVRFITKLAHKMTDAS